MQLPNRFCSRLEGHYHVKAYYVETNLLCNIHIMRRNPVMYMTRRIVHLKVLLTVIQTAWIL